MRAAHPSAPRTPHFLLPEASLLWVTLLLCPSRVQSSFLLSAPPVIWPLPLASSGVFRKAPCTSSTFPSSPSRTPRGPRPPRGPRQGRGLVQTLVSRLGPLRVLWSSALLGSAPCFHALHLLISPHPFSRAFPSRNSPLAPYAFIPVPPGFAGSESCPRVRSGQTRTWAASQDLPTFLCPLPSPVSASPAPAPPLCCFQSGLLHKVNATFRELQRLL